MASNADMFAVLGHSGLGILLFIMCANKVGMQWTALNIVYYVLIIVSAVVIQTSMLLIASSISLWTVHNSNILGVIFYNPRQFAGYPISVFPKFIQNILTYVLPFAFVNYFPAQFFLRKPDMEDYWEGFIYMPPFVAIIMIIIGLFFWRISLKRYNSVGN